MPASLGENSLMRIVGGKHRGRRLTSPKSMSIRPTSDRARESLFNIIAHKNYGGLPKGKTVLDVFAGTGALGFEALSRGAREVHFIEWGKSATKIIQQTACDLDETSKIKLLICDATQPGPATQFFDLVLMDAPYMSGQSELCLQALAVGGWLGKKCICCVELAKKEPFQASTGFTILDQRNYGAASIVILRWNGVI